MATLTRGITFGASETVTNSKLHNLVDLGAVSQIVDADCSPSMNLADTKLADITTGSKVRGTALANLASIPSGAGVIPTANIPVLGASMISLASIPNSALFPLTLTSWVDGASMRNIQSMPSLAGQLAWYSIVSSLASGGVPSYAGGGTMIGRQINNINLFSVAGTQVYNNQLTTSFSDVNLSAHVGSREALVFLGLRADGSVYVSARTNGLSGVGAGANVASSASYPSGMLAVMTDSSGIIEMAASSATPSIIANLIAYVYSG